MWILSLHLKAKALSMQFVSLIIPIKMACFPGPSLSMFLSYGSLTNEFKQIATVDKCFLIILANTYCCFCIADVLSMLFSLFAVLQGKNYCYSSSAKETEAERIQATKPSINDSIGVSTQATVLASSLLTPLILRITL